MERFKRKLKEKEIQELADFITDNALGSISVDTNAPTAASHMKRNEVKVVGTDLYIKMPTGKILKFTADSEIT